MHDYIQPIGKKLLDLGQVVIHEVPSDYPMYDESGRRIEAEIYVNGQFVDQGTLDNMYNRVANMFL